MDEQARTGGSFDAGRTNLAGQQSTSGAAGSTIGSTGSTTGAFGEESTKDRVVHQAKDKATDLTHRAKEQVTTRLDDQRGRMAEGLGGLATALSTAGQQLRRDNHETLPRYVDEIADQVERLSGYLRSRDVSDMFDEVDRFARRNPGIFVGSALALGFLGARFLKSSQHEIEGQVPIQRGYGSSGEFRGPQDIEFRSQYADFTPERSGSTGGFGSGTTGTSGTSTTGNTGYGASSSTGSESDLTPRIRGQGSETQDRGDLG